MNSLGLTEILIIAGIVIVLFGAKRLPDLARSVGRSAKIFKAETKGLRENEQASGTMTAQSTDTVKPATTASSALPTSDAVARNSTAPKTGYPEPNS